MKEQRWKKGTYFAGVSETLFEITAPSTYFLDLLKMNFSRYADVQ